MTKKKVRIIIIYLWFLGIT